LPNPSSRSSAETPERKLRESDLIGVVVIGHRYVVSANRLQASMAVAASITSSDSTRRISE